MGLTSQQLRTLAECNGDARVINGKKRFISNAGVADFYTVFARTGTQTEWASGSLGLRSWSTDAGFRVAERTTMLSPHPSGEIVRRMSRSRGGHDWGGGDGFFSRCAHLIPSVRA